MNLFRRKSQTIITDPKDPAVIESNGKYLVKLLIDKNLHDVEVTINKELEEMLALFPDQIFSTRLDTFILAIKPLSRKEKH